MPWWMTPLLCEVWCAPSRSSRSSTSTRRPRSASARAVASPTIPPPTTAMSVKEIERGADDRLGIDLVVLVELGDVARLAEVVHPEARDRRAGGAREERERVRVSVDERDDRDPAPEQPVDRRRIAL